VTGHTEVRDGEPTPALIRMWWLIWVYFH